MRITCPKCQFQGLIDIAPLVYETRVACVRCGETFEALLIEGEILTNIPAQEDEKRLPEVTFTAPAAQEVSISAPAAQEVSISAPALQAVQSGVDLEDVLALPQVSEADCQISEQVAVLEDVLLVAPPKVEVEAPANVLAFQDAQPAEEPLALAKAGVLEERLWDEPHFPAVADSDHARDFKPEIPAAVVAADYDRHNAGMRLMRISPLWLVVCGVVFVSVIILSNGFARSASQGPNVALNYTPTNNGATNQSLPQPLAPTAGNSSATGTQNAAPLTASAPNETKDKEPAASEQVAAQAGPETAPAPSIVPVVETLKDEGSAPAPQPHGESAGSITVQIGSYNSIEQANERVARLQSAGFSARVAVVELPKRGTWYRVQAGRFNSREEAARYGNQMKSKGAADTFIIADVEGGK